MSEDPLFGAKMRAALSDAITAFSEKQLQMVEHLTREQFIEVLVQAVEAGDFKRLVARADDFRTHRQGVVYQPWLGTVELRAENARLKARLEAVVAALDLDEQGGGL